MNAIKDYKNPLKVTKFSEKKSNALLKIGLSIIKEKK